MNTFGTLFRLTTFGESHGTALGGIVDGCPAGLVIDHSLIAAELLRRREGDTPSPLTTRRHEADEVEWLSGILDGKTLGTPIAFVIHNSDQRPADYEALRDCFRPGHADYTYMQKYGTRDYRGGGRASGRETAARVVGGSIAKMWLKEQHVAFRTHRDGRLITCTISGLPAGIGSPIFDRLNARLAYAVLSIPSAQSFVTGENPNDWQLPNDQYPDQWTPQSTGSNLTLTNHCGGIQGGISNGMPVVFHVGFHSPVTQPQGMTCRKADGTLTTVAPGGRHDVDHCSRLPVIVESMAALAVADSLMAAKAYNQQP